MSESSTSTLRDILLRLSNSIAESLATIPYTPHESSNISVKAFLEPLLTCRNSTIHASIKDFALACALLSSSTQTNSELLSWIPDHLSSLSTASFFEFSQAYLAAFEDRNSQKIAELGLNHNVVPPHKRLLLELMPEVLPFLKERIKESSIDKSDESDEFSAASARVPVGFAVVAAYQFRWFVTQVDYPHLGKLCGWVIPCALTAVDHWSPGVKGQGMVVFTHLGKNVDAAELGGYEDVILDACCQNIASDDEIWNHVVEASVLLVSLTQKMLEVGDGVFEVLSTSGDTHLVGDDFDKRIVDWLAADFKRDEGIDLLKDKQALQRLTETAEKAKIELSSLTQTNISLPFITATADGPKHIETTLTRVKFEEICSDLLDRLKTPVENSLRDAKLSLKDIDEVILVGGSTRIPPVQELVKMTGKDPNVTVNPDEVVALGAAVPVGFPSLQGTN